MKKIISCFLAVALSLSLFTVTASAVSAPVLYGDMNSDGLLDITDVSDVQSFLAEISEPSYLQWLLADYDHNGDVSVLDVTCIQKNIAEMELPEDCGGVLLTDISVYEFYADYDSGMTGAGTSVTFTAKAAGSGSGVTYEFLVDNKIEQPRGDSNVFVYKFENTGRYRVEVRAYNEWGFYRSDILTYDVLEKENIDELRIITSRVYSDTIDRYKAYFEAAGGTAPYTYSLMILPRDGYGEEGLSEYDVLAYNDYAKAHETEWQLMYDVDNNAYLYRDFSVDNTAVIDEDMLCFYYTDYRLAVQAKDADGRLSEIKTLTLPGY